MTAEVVVMNKSAVALAADSASTVTAKVFNSAEKLFMLVPGHPVALMIYNHSEFMQLPWETIVKKYRIINKGKPFGTLEKYAKDFLDFLKRYPENKLYTDKQFEVTFIRIVNHYLEKIANGIVQDIKKRIENKARRISQTEISQIISDWINYFYKRWNRYENQYSNENVTKLKGYLSSKYQNILNQSINSVFGNAQLSNIDKGKITKFLYSLFYKKEIIDFYTGIVVAGFGENELYPRCEEYIVENFFGGYLKFTQLRSGIIGPEDLGCIISFAQKDIVINFMNGIHPDFENELSDELNNIFIDENMQEIKNALKGLSRNRKEKIYNSIKKLKEDKIDTLLNRAQTNFNLNHTDSILNTVAILPKDELAKMAESLVNITSFMRRVSMEVETVGGPIDVAVISKKDGFIWIKRKHYFDKLYNPHFNSIPINGGIK